MSGEWRGWQDAWVARDNERESAQTDQEPVAMRYGWDGYGYQYIDGGSGSYWAGRHADAEPLYTRPKRESVQPVQKCDHVKTFHHRYLTNAQLDDMHERMNHEVSREDICKIADMLETRHLLMTQRSSEREIVDVKPGTLPININEALEALHTQYQFCGDAIIARRSPDAPTDIQLGRIRGAHLNIIPILKALKVALQEPNNPVVSDEDRRYLVMVMQIAYDNMVHSSRYLDGMEAALHALLERFNLTPKHEKGWRGSETA